MAKRLRLVVAALSALLLAWVSFSHAMVTVTHTRNPRLALRFDGDDPVALARAAHAALAVETTRETARDAIEAARKSIEQQALNARAFQLLGIAAEGDDAEGRVPQQIAFGARLSRHDLAPQLWLIEQAVRRNDIAAALDHYDITLRKHEDSEALLYPVLTKALEEPAIRRRFIPYLNNPPPWMQRFLNYALTNSAKPAALASLSVEAGGFPKGAGYEDFDGFLIRRFAEVGDFSGAVAYYGRLRKNAGDVLRSSEMTEQSTDQRYAPITWQPFLIDGMSANFVSGETDQLQLNVQLEPTFSGPIARKILALPRGTYDISAEQRAERFGPLSRTVWRVVCGSGAATPLLNARTSLSEANVMRGSFTVPASCPLQVLSIEATAGTESGGVDLLIGPVRVRQQ